jgi:hypothetical protein
VDSINKLVGINISAEEQMELLLRMQVHKMYAWLRVLFENVWSMYSCLQAFFIAESSAKWLVLPLHIAGAEKLMILHVLVVIGKICSFCAFMATCIVCMWCEPRT